MLAWSLMGTVAMRTASRVRLTQTVHTLLRKLASMPIYAASEPMGVRVRALLTDSIRALVGHSQAEVAQDAAQLFLRLAPHDSAVVPLMVRLLPTFKQHSLHFGEVGGGGGGCCCCCFGKGGLRLWGGCGYTCMRASWELPPFLSFLFFFVSLLLLPCWLLQSPILLFSYFRRSIVEFPAAVVRAAVAAKVCGEEEKREKRAGGSG